MHQTNHSSTTTRPRPRPSSTSFKMEDILERPRSRGWRWFQELRLLQAGDLFFSVDLTALWRRHLVWSRHQDGKELLDIITSRFASTQIFLSLLFAAEVGTYFSPSRIVTDVRGALRTGPTQGDPLHYACGTMLILSISVTGSAVLANYTALGVFRCLSPENAAMILRSDVGLYAAQLPARLTFAAIMTFFAWNVLFWWINNEGYHTPSIAMTVVTIVLLCHVIATFSTIGRIIMATSAMSSTPILPKGTEERLLPHQLTNVLLSETIIAQQLQTPVNLQYYQSPSSTEYNTSEEDPPTTAPIPTYTYETSLRRRHPDIQLEHVQEVVLAE